MVTAPVVIVGGGPAGSACAWRLRQHGIESIVLDSEAFPRTKLCAGWVTPEVVQSLHMDAGRYPHGLLALKRIHVEYFGKRRRWAFGMDSGQYSIRRYEFDDWLLERSGARVFHHCVRDVRRDDDLFVIDGEFRGKFLVGAGGTHCPVFRSLFRAVNPRSREHQVAALEEEFRCDSPRRECHLWFGEHGLVGYAWYVPKDNGWVNVGLGGFCEYLSESEIGLREHWEAFTEKLDHLGLVGRRVYNAKGHTYYIREGVEIGQLGNAYVIGDAAGLATCDLAEGIGPAIESGLGAADAIATGRPYSPARIHPYSLIGSGLLERAMRHVFDRRGLCFRDRVYARGWREKERAFQRAVVVERDRP